MSKIVRQKIKDIVKNNEVLFKNISFLTILQVFTLLFPLITYPYLIRVVGKELYGTVVYAKSIVAYFVIIINFGFNISGIKDISINRDNPEKLSEIVSSIYLIKICLFFLCFIIFAIIVYLVPFFRRHYLLFIFTYGITLGEVLLPTWFYQGIEKMKYMTYVSVLSKFVFTICIFFFIHSESQYLYIPVFLSLGSIVGGFVSFFLVFKKEKVSFIIPKYSIVWDYVKRTVPFFLSRLSGVLYSETNTVVIGAYLGMGDVAYYDLAKKITNLFLLPNSIINTAVYPKIAKFKELEFVKKILHIRILLSLFLYVFLFFTGNFIVKLLGGSEMLPAYGSVMLYGIFIIISAISYYVGGTVLVSFDYEKKFNMSVIYSFILYVFVMGCLMLLGLVSLLSVVITFLVIETTLALYRYYFCKKFKLL